ncbi:metal-binding protein [Thermosynechococcaceae cyanobacterium BACA0444]|uniref:Metal-binding protein n=1 Tax=Pseudocalidococcus azoricus BACA0444 TaxID=2918990 RepID=A0AAE4FS82_9CYAN|nr:metal-binding protein [Pseudocalidococcus azoricus]MDS3859986.1 metal-binding protein [Pseudocalidococcus azoricus BACA0444]
MKQPDILRITRKAASLKEKRAKEQAENPESPAITPSPALSREVLPPEPFAPLPQKDQNTEQLESREWWSQRWVDVLESFGWRRRMERARNYVREGRVLNLEFNKNQVFAQVQGTAPAPYNVELSLDPFTEEQWQFVIEAMADQALFAAKLLAGEMPHNIESAFISSGLSLFPFSKFDIHSHCDCPDPVNPCKHIGAVYYLLGEHFGRDPFILFQLRGKSKAAITQQLRQLRSSEEPTGQLPQPPISEAKPLYSPPEIGRFWDYTASLDATLMNPESRDGSEQILSLLGPIPLTTSGSSSYSLQTIQGTMNSVERIYQALRDYVINLETEADAK